MKLSTILFDMDGTILDSAPDFIAVTEQMLQARNLSSVDDKAIQQVVSGGAKAMVLAAFDVQDNTEELETLRLEFLDRYLKECAVRSHLYEGIEPLLCDLEKAGLRWGIVTNKPVRFAEPIVECLGLQDRCSVLVCPEHVSQCKPSPEPLLLASKLLSIKPETILYIGDDRRDIESGNAAGCKTVAVTYGYVHPQDNPNSWGAGAVVHSVDELRVLIDRVLCGC